MTNVIRNGEWVLADATLNDALNSQKTKEISGEETVPEPRPDRPPNLGILTRTVVESPVAHWMLPVRLRSAQHMDVAVIGVSSRLPLLDSSYSTYYWPGFDLLLLRTTMYKSVNWDEMAGFATLFAKQTLVPGSEMPR